MKKRNRGLVVAVISAIGLSLCLSFLVQEQAPVLQVLTARCLALCRPASRKELARACVRSRAEEGRCKRRQVASAVAAGFAPGTLASIAGARAEGGGGRPQLDPRFFSTVGDKGKPGGEAILLNSGLEFPKVSFGPQVYPFGGDDKCRELTKLAIKVGYRNFFASVLARNQRGFAMGIKDSGIPRDEVFICGSVETRGAKGFQEGYLQTKRGCEENLKAFGAGDINYVDMIMLDYPAKDSEAIRGQWKAFGEMLQAGQTRSVAVSNFGLSQLDCILEDPANPVPAVNQLRFNVEAYDPGVPAAIVEENRKRGVVVQAWSPLRAKGPKRKLAADIGARKGGRSAAQVMLRWILQSGATYTTQSTREDHLAENLRVFDFELEPDEMQLLSA